MVILDEAVSALDKSVEAQVLNLLRRLKQTLNLTYLFISHDLNVVRYMSERVLVMYLGPVVEVLRAPAHPYAAGLLASTVHDQAPSEDIAAIPGSPPDLRRLPPGCSFAPRCGYAVAACREGFPAPVYPAPGRMACCLRVADVLKD